MIRAVIRKTYIPEVWSLSWIPDFSVTHKTPSAHCWRPNISGITPKGMCAGLFTLARVAAPMTDITALAVKLVSAEKHIKASYVTFYTLNIFRNLLLLSLI